MTLPERPHRPARPGDLARTRAVPAVLAALAALAVGCGDSADRSGADRQADVADRGRAVMPFDVERTTHRFTKTDTGGVQTVTADDPADARQITLVREHLRGEAERFARGDFADPARIHGNAMPGLAALRAGARDRRITVGYRPAGDGGRITYTTADPALRTALHAWFDAQVTDHGRHAEPGTPTPR
jgi:hypothetical protein